MIQTEGRPKFLMLNTSTEADCGKHFVLININVAWWPTRD